MLEIQVEAHEFYDGHNEVFFYTKPFLAKLEHSLISISRWEAHFKKPYIPSGGHSGISTYKEELYYLECMLIGNAPKHIPSLLAQHHMHVIRDYIADSNTATKIYRIGDTPPSTKTVTAELIYYWMIKFGIPFECEKWHFNRLLMLIDVCNVKESESNKKGNNMSTMDSVRYRHMLNKARRGS